MYGPRSRGSITYGTGLVAGYTHYKTLKSTTTTNWSKHLNRLLVTVTNNDLLELKTVLTESIPHASDDELMISSYGSRPNYESIGLMKISSFYDRDAWKAWLCRSNTGRKYLESRFRKRIARLKRVHNFCIDRRTRCCLYSWPSPTFDCK